MKTTDTKPYGSIGNPIHAKGVDGELEYFHCLRTQSGRPFFYHRLGNFNAPNMGHPVDVYELIAYDNSERWVLAISPYHSETSSKPPIGLIFDPLRCYSPFLTGTNNSIDNFPIGLLGEFQDGDGCKAIYDYFKGILDRIPKEEWKKQNVNNVVAHREIPANPSDRTLPSISVFGSSHW